ncbi:response regulator [Ramlibacter tataouinensis]|uniref:Candidate response regulator, OmpR n=1 Tax=Ramlibacter tataouinensis (strain ATCC BAA-407 / DSM 14655 / LMG 21543 / TTB310) TaxID=365046 RepID=F5Y4D8_RAMTT|nr:response regulator [Ramlibacter tataouinensis]AEG93785.1 candidate response regulator, OmpR [Ramlibacter tataouinensis TTB310]
MSKASVLVVEDEPAIARFVCASLSAAGLLPRRVGTVAQAEAELAAAPADLLLVDLGLPDEDGVAFIARLRQTSGVPVLVLSARAQEPQKIEALDAGADDYLAKPFGMGELLARVRAMLRRAAAAPLPAPVLRVGELAFDRGSRELRLRGAPIHLTPRELRLFEVLAAAQGRVVTHRQLLAAVWGAEQVDQLHYLRIYMGHLRAKLEANPAEPRYLLTELGAGYRLADE